MSGMAKWPAPERGLVAILRGVKPEEAVAIGEAVFEAGITAIEVPLNSPDPFASIELLAKALPGALIGAGTVLSEDDVSRLNDSGGRLLVSPNIDERVMRRAADFEMVAMPGVFTATEAFLALRLGASALKFFPAITLGPSGIAAIRAVLPKNTVIGAVGGISDRDFSAYLESGVSVFGLGSSLYRPGLGAGETGKRAKAAVETWDRLHGAFAV